MLRFRSGVAVYFSVLPAWGCNVPHNTCSTMETNDSRKSFDALPGNVVALMEQVEVLTKLVVELRGARVRSDWMDMRELIEFLPGEVNPKTVYAWMEKEGLPGYRRGRFWMFNRVEVEMWIRKGGK